MSRSRALLLSLLAFIFFINIVECATLVRYREPEFLDVPIGSINKRNQFYGLFKKLSYESHKPSYYFHDGFGWHR
ncbi:hypothetical protein OESDEN_02108 [Oesophagostomum dentatum]|uniref:Uncharacterized protein n=1 Tax=Oesophagostomum dentatum TaxID=61180 RepID=A0A0B1SQ71_OESDE|nr:hypothetical protein OESDEN_14221 [Oesophagostomum dentatum]KHJ97906.1 hypothetical protein OESDEN_02108 [Oesophagostomum dentatum]